MSRRKTLATQEPAVPDPAPRRALTTEEEAAFQRWYAAHAARLGLDPNPDAPEHHYDYRAAFQAGAEPSPDGHWPSQFKGEEHPNRYVNGQDTRTGGPMPLADYLERLTQGTPRAVHGPGGPEPLDRVIQEGSDALLRALQADEAGVVPPGSRPYLPTTMTDAQPIHEQVRGAEETYPEHFYSDARVPRPMEPVSPREQGIIEEIGRMKPTLAVPEVS